jgi:hypothetical protein
MKSSAAGKKTRKVATTPAQKRWANRKENDAAAVRREWVARLRLRGLSTRKIARALLDVPPPDGPICQANGRPMSKTTVENDLDYLRGEWRADAVRQIDEHMQEQLALLREAQREAWQQKDVELVLRVHDRIAKLLGTNAPDRQEITGRNGGPIEVDDVLAARQKLAKLIDARAKSGDPG